MTQKEIIFEHLMKYRTITPLEAITRYGITRLAAVVFNLKQDGYDISTTLKEHNDKHYASYKLESYVTKEYSQMELAYE